jgi:hypothetical protein
LVYPTRILFIFLLLMAFTTAFADDLNDRVAPGGFMHIRPEQAEHMGRRRFVERMAEMLIKSEAVDPETDQDFLKAKVAEALDEAEGHGIKTERLMGMYVILRLADKVVPYDIPEYAKILREPSLQEADKAHLIQMIRVDAL